MAIVLTTAYKAALKSGSNSSNIILEVVLDSGTVKWGQHAGGFSDVIPILKDAASLQNKIDTKGGYTTRGQMSFTILGRDNFKNLIRDSRLKNRRVTRKDGFIGTAYTDYVATYTGKITDWSRSGDELTIMVADDMVEATRKIPVENATKTQYLDYRNMNPVDIMQNILGTQLGIAAGYINTTQFDSEQSVWLSGLIFDRVITKSEKATKYLEELQIETNSFIFHDGEKISFKYFGPAVPNQDIPTWTDNLQILSGSLKQKSGYGDQLFNRVVLYYDYDESGSDGGINFESVVIASNIDSQGAAEWNEIKTKEIKSKWIRTRTYTQPSNVTGVVMYHVSKANGTGAGTLTYNYAANTLTWTAPSGSAGETVVLSKDGAYQIFDANKTKWIRVLVTTASLPSSNQSDTITITSLNGTSLATSLTTKILSRYRDPVMSFDLQIDVNDCIVGSNFFKPTDLVDVTTDEAFMLGKNTLTNERMMITSLRPDFGHGKVSVSLMQTGIPPFDSRRYGFIAPAGFPDYPDASVVQRAYAYIGRASDNKVNAGTETGFSIW